MSLTKLSVLKYMYFKMTPRPDGRARISLEGAPAVLKIGRKWVTFSCTAIANVVAIAFKGI